MIAIIPTARGACVRSVRTGLLSVLAAASECGDARLPTDPPRPEALVASLEVVSGAGQRIWSGRRSSAPFRVRARDGAGVPLAGVEVAFKAIGTGGGDPSQPLALSDEEGFAESWLLRTTTGAGVMVAEAGGGRAELPFLVDRAPAEIRFLPGSGEPGLPGQPHPDSILGVHVLDTDGHPLAGQEVWFAGPGTLSRHADTTDADGAAGTVLRRTELGAGSGDVWAFILNFPDLLAHDTRPLVAPARRVVLVSVDGLRADALERWNAPTLRRLASEGAHSVQAVTVSPSLTAPAHLSMLSGVSPEAHGIFTDVLDVTPQMASLDPLFRHAARLGRRTAAFMSLEGPLGEFERALPSPVGSPSDSTRSTSPRQNRTQWWTPPSPRWPTRRSRSSSSTSRIRTWLDISGAGTPPPTALRWRRWMRRWGV